MTKHNNQWSRPTLTDEQLTKTMLLDITIWRAESGHSFLKEGDLIISKPRGDAPIHMYVRPIGSGKPGGFITVRTIDEVFELAADPEKFGGKWTQ